MKIGLQITKNELKYVKLLNILKHNLKIKEPLDFINIKDDFHLSQKIHELDILVCYHIKKENFLKSSAKLKWIHCGAAGVDHIMYPEVIKSKVIITNASGIHATPIAEYVLGCMLYLTKQFSACEEFKKSKKWTQWDIAKKIIQLKNKTVGIIGFGSLGKGIAKLAKSFGMEVHAIRRLQKKTESKKNVDKLMPMSQIEDVFSASDFIVVACPLTPKTKEMINKKHFNQMSKNSFFINIARGGIINEQDLIAAIETKQIAGAALDVFDKEPLDSNHKLFNLDNVLLSPHISGNFPEYQDEVMIQFANHLNRYILGKALPNRVCKKRLY